VRLSICLSLRYVYKGGDKVKFTIEKPDKSGLPPTQNGKKYNLLATFMPNPSTIFFKIKNRILKIKRKIIFLCSKNQIQTLDRLARQGTKSSQTHDFDFFKISKKVKVMTLTLT
jgi:hypothetical protein